MNKPRRYFVDRAAWSKMSPAEKDIILSCRTGSLRIDSKEAAKRLSAYRAAKKEQ
jgi:predicted Fe-S protein YdhL (DUF1289 family)